MIYFTSDTHFGHSKVIDFCNRPFSSVEEMDETLIQNWNKTVGKKDTIYHLGDFSFKPEKYVSRLNGTIILIMGGHDRINKVKNLFSDVFQSKTIKYNKNIIVLSHFCYRVWDRSHYNSWHLYGHSHGSLPPIGKSMDVGVDCNNFTPVLINQIETIMEGKPDNPNYVGKKQNNHQD